MAVPILIHLLARRRFRRIRWAAVAFLLEAERKNRRRIRIEQLILLALRCLAVLLMALLISRPFSRPGGLASWFGSGPRTERIVLMDDSFSMGYRADNDSSFDRARRAVTQLVNWAYTERPEDTVTVLLSSRPDRPLLERTSVDAAVVESLAAALNALEPSQRRASPREALTTVRAMLDRRGDALNVAVYVLSDFQSGDWSSDVTRSATALDPVAALADWSDDARSLEMTLVDLGTDDAANLAVTDIRAAQSQVVAGVDADFVIAVTNFSRRPVADQTLRVFLGDAALPAVVADAVAPGQTVTLPIRLTFPEAGYEALRVEADPDGLAVDDSRTLAVPVLPAVDVLLVNGAPSPHWYLDEVTVLQAALQPEGNVISGNRVRVIEESELDEVDFGAFHLVMLANVFRVSESAAKGLERYVDDGGGLVVYLGDQVDADMYNRVLYREGAGLLPAQLGEPVETATRGGVGFGASDLVHPVMRMFADQTNALAGRIHFWSYIASVPASAPTLINGNGNGADAEARAPARVILPFNDADRTPAIVERNYGRGRVVLVTSSCDSDWNDWPADPSYVILALEIARYAARAENEAGDRLVGAPIDFDLDVDRFEPSTVLRLPGYPLVPQVDVQAQTGPEGATFSVAWDKTDHSGVYAFVLTPRAGEPARRLEAVNVDPRESDLARIDRIALEQSMPANLAVKVLQDLDFAEDEVSQARQEYWPGILVFLVIVLMLEHTLAWWFGQRS